MHDIQHRDYDENAEHSECDNDTIEHRKSIESSSGMDIDSPIPYEITETSTSSAIPNDTVIDESALNLTTTTPSTINHPDIWAAEVTVRDRSLSGRNSSPSDFGSTHVYGISSGVLSMAQGNPAQPVRLTQVSSNGGYRYMYVPKKSIPQNVRRMLYSIEQPNKGQGLIKEECFSSCGRLICSPYGLGFRLLSFSPDCLELPNALEYQKEAHKLTELKYFKCHPDIVVSTRFSPIQPLLASGCLQGRIIWHQPRF